MAHACRSSTTRPRLTSRPRISSSAGRARPLRLIDGALRPRHLGGNSLLQRMRHPRELTAGDQPAYGRVEGEFLTLDQADDRGVGGALLVTCEISDLVRVEREVLPQRLVGEVAEGPPENCRSEAAATKSHK